MERGSSFEALQHLARCFEALDARAGRRQCEQLGAVAMPLLLRELGGGAPRRAHLACQLIAELAVESDELRARALRGLHALAGAADDAVKARAMGLLHDLGAQTSATFADPEAVQRQSAVAIAEQLGSDAEVAAAADLMTKQLDPDEMVSLLEIMTETAPEKAVRLVRELSGRVDLEGSVRSDVRRLAAASLLERELMEEEPGAPASPPARRRRARTTTRAPQPAQPAHRAASVLVLADEQGCQVVMAVQKSGGQRRWRRFAVLVGADGVLEDCLYEDDVPAAELGAPENAPLYSGLLAEGYRLVSDDAERGRAIAAEAARRAAATPHRLTSSYYLGRDLLELGDQHLGPRPAHLGRSEIAIAVGRAVDLLAAGEVLRARELALLCARVAPENPDVASTLGQCHLAAGELTAAAEWLGRAAAAEPGWPMHHWNLAVVHHRADCPSACADALASYLAAAESKSLEGDDGREERIALARRYLAAHRQAPTATPPKLRGRRGRRLPRPVPKIHARED
jgi:hypothetical protein